MREASQVAHRWNARHEDRKAAFSRLHGLAIKVGTWDDYQRWLKGGELFDD